MNEEQLIDTLQACYFGDRGAFNKILKEYKILQTENQQLKEKLNQYENPDDLTLFYMWLDEKAKDKMKCLEFEKEQLNSLVNSCQQEIRNLKSTLEEIREYIMKNIENNAGEGTLFIGEVADLLQIIDKGVNND